MIILGLTEEEFDQLEDLKADYKQIGMLLEDIVKKLQDISKHIAETKV